MGGRYQAWLDANPKQTTGWRPTCDHEKGEGWYWCEDCQLTRRIEELTNGCPKCGETMTPAPPDPVPCVVLDPFGGSGTVGAVAVGNGRDAVLCELNPEYTDMAERRIGPMWIVAEPGP